MNIWIAIGAILLSFWLGSQAPWLDDSEDICDVLRKEEEIAKASYFVASQDDPHEFDALTDYYADLASGWYGVGSDDAYELGEQVAGDIYSAREKERRAAAEFLRSALEERGCEPTD